MERLSGLDASFLYSESETVPLHVCSIVELDPRTIPGGYSFDRFRSELSSRIGALPELRAKLADTGLNLDHPVWVEDNDFDLDRHLFRISLPSPGGRRELTEVCGHIASAPLDRSKPVWEMWVIEGIAGTDPHRGGPLGLMIKVHHAAVDGVSGANLLNTLCDTAPDAAPPEPVRGCGGATKLGIAADGLLRFLARPVRAAKVVPAAMATIGSTVTRAVTGTAMSAPFSAPPTRFNAELTPERTVAFAQLDLDDVKRVKNRFGVKVNDVVMTLCAGALRDYLRYRGELPDKPLKAVVPASAHEQSDRPGRNQLSTMFCNLHTDIADPAERLEAIAESNWYAKDHNSAIAPTLLADLSQIVTRQAFEFALGVMRHTPLTHTPIHNVVISNVAGPPTTLYAMGAEMTALYPLGPIFHGSGLNITVMSLAGKLNVGIISCRDLVDDLWDLADRFEIELAHLLSGRMPGVR